MLVSVAFVKIRINTAYYNGATIDLFFRTKGNIIPLATTARGKESCETDFIPISASIYLPRWSSERLDSVLLHLLFLGHAAYPAMYRLAKP